MNESLEALAWAAEMASRVFTGLITTFPAFESYIGCGSEGYPDHEMKQASCRRLILIRRYIRTILSEQYPDNTTSVDLYSIAYDQPAPDLSALCPVYANISTSPVSWTHGTTGTYGGKGGARPEEPTTLPSVLVFGRVSLLLVPMEDTIPAELMGPSKLIMSNKNLVLFTYRISF
jgi:hypothetical protein